MASYIHIYVFSFVSLFEVSPELGESVLSKPLLILPTCDEALVEVQSSLLSDIDAGLEPVVKSNIHTRITGIHSYYLKLFRR